MIKFFRTIRQRLLSENKFSKYLLYAFGEIILVVIGILIALQINNWNNTENNRKAELEYLTQIESSLEDNNLILKNKIELDKDLLKKGAYLYAHIKAKKPINDSIKKLLVILQYDQMISFNLAAFENIKNDGLSFISNDELKFEIINIYDQELTYIQNVFAHQYENYISTVINPFYSDNFEFGSKENQLFIEPNNYEELLQNDKITNIISMVNTMRSFAISNYGETQIKIKALLTRLENEKNVL